MLAVATVTSGVVGAGEGAAALTASRTLQRTAGANEIGYAGSAFGTEVDLSGAIESGKSAYVTLGCTSTAGITHTDTVATMNLPALTTGTIDTLVASESSSAGSSSMGTSEVQLVSVLGGLVTANLIESATTTTLSTTGQYSVSASGTQFVSLTVAGVPITYTPAPNTKLTLPGVGYVVLNQQQSFIGTHSAHLDVTAIHLVVTLSTPLAPIGTQVLVAAARSSLGGPVVGLLGGGAYGASANLVSAVIGPQFPQPMPCLGTHGATLTNPAASVTIPGVLSSGTVADTAEGVANRGTVSGQTSSTIESLNLVSGLVTATAVEANVSAVGNPPALTDNSQFVGLSVAGFPAINDSVPPNTKLSIPGLGTLWLHRVIKSANSINVIMVELVVTVPSNPAGLAVGAVVQVAWAKVRIG